MRVGQAPMRDEVRRGTRARERLPWVVVLVGIAGLASLQAITPHGVFFAGDAGVKLLLTQRIAEGRMDGSLDPAVPSWVRKRWEAGLFPLEPPFAYESGGRFRAGFPATVPLLSAPFYRLFGFRGLHVLPGLAAVVIWAAFLVGARRLGLSPPQRTFAVALLVFGTPVALYGAMFWEHTLAVAFAFGGLVLLLERGVTPAWRLAAGGALVGASVWFREELLALALALAGVSLLPERLRRASGLPRRNAWAIGLGVGSAVFIYLSFNLFVYGGVLGVRDLQVDLGNLDVKGNLWEEKPRLALAIARSLYTKLADSFPPVGLCFVLALVAVVSWRRRLPGGTRFLLAATLAVLALTPLLPLNDGGKQLGPRYLLVVFPLMTLLGADLLRQGARHLPKPMLVALCAAATLLSCWSIVINSWQAPGELRAAYHKRSLAVAALRQDPSLVVAVSDQFVAQQLAVLWTEKLFFLTRHGKELKTLVAAAAEQGIDRLAFLCNPVRRGARRARAAALCLPFEGTPDHRRLRLDDARAIDAVRVGDAGQYIVYHLEVVPATTETEVNRIPAGATASCRVASPAGGAPRSGRGGS